MLFSIIIPTYNSENSISRCLLSIFNQCLIDFEILIIDGCSKDNTLKIAKDFNDTRIKVYSSPDNGPYDAMNKGISYAKGEWLYFLGSDDEFYDERVLYNVSQHIKKAKPSVVYGSVFVIGNTDWAKDKTVYAGKFDLSRILKQNICHQAIFYKRKIFDKIGFYNLDYKVCADWDINLKAWAKFGFSYMDAIIANFYGGNTSSNNNKDLAFGNAKWKNTVEYFGWKIFNKKFLPHFVIMQRLYRNNKLNIRLFAFCFIYKPLFSSLK